MLLGGKFLLPRSEPWTLAVAQTGSENAPWQEGSTRNKAHVWMFQGCPHDKAVWVWMAVNKSATEHLGMPAECDHLSSSAPWRCANLDLSEVRGDPAFGFDVSLALLPIRFVTYFVHLVPKATITAVPLGRDRALWGQHIPSPFGKGLKGRWRIPTSGGPCQRLPMWVDKVKFHQVCCF